MHATVTSTTLCNRLPDSVETRTYDDVEAVKVEEGCLVLFFAEQAHREPVRLPLTRVPFAFIDVDRHSAT
jgi:hypothetical protein